MIRELIDKTIAKYLIDATFNEDQIVNAFIDKIAPKKGIVLEVGSGLGRYARILKKRKNLGLTCLEINPDLAKLTQEQGIKTIQGNFLDLTIVKNKYDLVHCSHFIEHFK